MKLKCAMIPDRTILEFLARHQNQWCTHGEQHYLTDGSKSMPTVQDVMPTGTPFKLQLAKMRMLFRRGLVTGCDCGCRGDWEVTDRGLKLIGQIRTGRQPLYGNIY